MAKEEQEQQKPTTGAMVGHLQRYKAYIDGLKSGSKSGISTIFGSAGDILPEAVGKEKGGQKLTSHISEPAIVKSHSQVVIPQAKPEVAPEVTPAEAPVLAPNVDSDNALIGSADAQVRILRQGSDHGQHAARMAESAEKGQVEAARKSEETKETKVTNETNQTNETNETNETQHTKDTKGAAEDHVGYLVRTEEGQAEVLSIYSENGVRMYMLSDLSVIDERTFAENMLSKPSCVDEISVQETAFERELPEESRSTLTELAVSTPNGTALWQVYFGESGPERIFMADGGVIQRAEHSNVFVYSSLESMQTAFYILTGLVVDPSTGNIFIEVGNGTFTNAFLNNGWRIEQFKTDGNERYFVREPIRPDRMPARLEVSNLHLNMDTGEVTYQTLDGSASMCLKCRQIAKTDVQDQKAVHDL